MSLLEKASKLKLGLEPLLVVVMGVSGTGKSTLASEFARRYQFTFLDADSLHSDRAIRQMSQGIPLTDDQRSPWIQRIYARLSESHSQNKNCILAYSGLKQAHRKVVFSSYTTRAGVLLNADQDLIMERLAKRSAHFMSPQLLNSQIAEMELFDSKEPLLQLNSDESLEILLKQLESFVSAINTKT
ncbi:MAG: gluconokinase, GntK/IdnK-type [Porticoccaceae bacterium]|jgi:gluconokinase|nr:gluconokinase, GntK/IdnK-type [Porticoccaceae bacterium]